MNLEFIPFEQAKDLKELGFDEKCLTSYASDGDLMSVWNVASDYVHKIIMKNETDTSYTSNSANFKNSNWCAAPLYQQAFRWLREKYDLRYSIGKTNICVYHVPVNNYYTTFMIQDCKTFEEAELKCIQEFIKIVKNNSTTS